jgi:hypothetical protein
VVDCSTAFNLAKPMPKEQGEPKRWAIVNAV